jgi:hypothetical protein
MTTAMRGRAARTELHWSIFWKPVNIRASEIKLLHILIMVPMIEKPALMTAFLRSAALGAAVVAAAAAGVAGAGTASASTAHRGTFCTAINAGGDGVCAIAEGAQPVRMLEDPQQDRSPTTWAYPIQGGYQQIHGNLSLTDPLCMQLDHAKSNEVIEARCANATYQEWAPVHVSKTDPLTGADLYEFRSDWDQKLCLRYNTSHHVLDDATCASPNTLTYAQDFTG